MDQAYDCALKSHSFSMQPLNFSPKKPTILCFFECSYSKYYFIPWHCILRARSSIWNGMHLTKELSYRTRRPRTTDTQRELVFEESKLLSLGRQIEPKFFGAFGGIFGQTISIHFGAVSPLSMFSIIQPLFLQKTKSLCTLSATQCGTVSPLSMFSINQSLFFTKN